MTARYEEIVIATRLDELVFLGSPRDQGSGREVPLRAPGALDLPEAERATLPSRTIPCSPMRARQRVQGCLPWRVLIMAGTVAVIIGVLLVAEICM